MRARFIALLLIVIPAAPLLASEFVSRPCGVAFRVPATWSVVPAPRKPTNWGLPRKSVRCVVGLRPRGWMREVKESEFDLREYAIEIVVVADLPFRKVAKRAGFMQIRDYDPSEVPSTLDGLGPDDWSIAVRQGEEPAAPFRTDCCQGVRGSTWGRVWTRDGDVGTATEENAVLDGGHGRSAIINSGEDERFRDAVTVVLESFRFLSSP